MDTQVEYKRLREFALQAVGYALNWTYGSSFAAEGALLALSGHTEDAWVKWSSITDAKDGQWFVWRDLDGRYDDHADRVVSDSGVVVGKHSCGLNDYLLCQPCRFAPDVTAAMTAATGEQVIVVAPKVAPDNAEKRHGCSLIGEGCDYPDCPCETSDRQ